ncbi:hypothetical protein H6P81_006716 [Aristolochia fimbriata]|uniref:Uncharacterized protein n=1 Tax=Aristolochia fimbriata TaxID=158543 RepID=A0AAV7F1Y8_ARIFI|nr:hypothetical protein H6P81_006716 [Aristolochia fimbriata]
MSSGCISGCVDDVRARAPVRVTYVNLHRWPESDAEFVKSVVYGEKGASGRTGPRVVDSYSCRQMYLRSYTFSREETVPEKTRKCFGRVKQRVSIKKKNKGGSGGSSTTGKGAKKKCFAMRKMKEVSCSAFFSVFSRLLSCTTSIDVVDR